MPVEVHTGNGCLLDQFLCDSTNLREDAYGGSVENRIRLLIEVTAAVIEVVEAALSRSAVLLVNGVGGPEPGCLNINALGRSSPSRIG